MQSLKDQFQAKGGRIVYQTEVTGIDKHVEGFKVTVWDFHEGEMSFLSKVVINCAGLFSDQVAGLAGLKKNEYRLKFCKGSYFRLHNSKAKLINQLIYPVPKKDRAGLGIHATLDLAGGLRLGPDDEYVDNLNYDVDPSKKEIFYQSSRAFLPFIQRDDLSPDTAGIRPKLQGEGEPFRDFIIKDETENNLAGLINLIGIESPGFTSSLAISRIVNSLLQKKGKHIYTQLKLVSRTHLENLHLCAMLLRPHLTGWPIKIGRTNTCSISTIPTLFMFPMCLIRKDSMSFVKHANKTFLL